MASTMYHCGAEQYWQREIGYISPRKFARTAGGSLDLVQRLALHDTLEGHDGCVNTVAFNPTGELLISGSDDLKIVLWDWEARFKRTAYHSGHCNNVFQARSMPFSGDRTIVSCAADGEVRVGQLRQDGSCETRKLGRHRGRAHKLALEPGSGTCFFSCGEDGVVRHFDLRENRNLKLFTCSSLSLGKESGRRRRRTNGNIGLHSIVVNPVDSNQFAIGGSDEYARIYDFRMSLANAGSDKPVACYAPDHLRNGPRNVHITCVAFSQQGELLVSYNDELIYLFQQAMSVEATAANRASPDVDSEPSKPSTSSKTDGTSCHSSDRTPQVYKGHRNAQTIKGVNFFGPNSEYVVSGSDCGRIFIWQKVGGKLVALLLGDTQVVNCLEPHPTATILATSGIENDVKIWTPTADSPKPLPPDAEKVMLANERRRVMQPPTLTPEVLMHLLRLQRRAADTDLHMPRNPFDADSEEDRSSSDGSDDEDEQRNHRRRRAVQCEVQ